MDLNEDLKDWWTESADGPSLAFSSTDLEDFQFLLLCQQLPLTMLKGTKFVLDVPASVLLHFHQAIHKCFNPTLSVRTYLPDSLLLLFDQQDWGSHVAKPSAVSDIGINFAKIIIYRKHFSCMYCT